MKSALRDAGRAWGTGDAPAVLYDVIKQSPVSDFDIHRGHTQLLACRLYYWFQACRQV